MFVGGGVEDCVHTVCAERVAYGGFVGNVGDDIGHVDFRVGVPDSLEVLPEMENSVFVLVNADEDGWRVVQDSLAQRCADGAGGSGDANVFSAHGMTQLGRRDCQRSVKQLRVAEFGFKALEESSVH